MCIAGLVFAFILVLASCGPAIANTFSYTPDAGTAIVPIGDILSHPEAYRGKEVVVQGKIISECPSGCWFTMKDDSGAIYVDLKPANLAIPQKTGKTVVVLADVVVQGSDTTLAGKKLGF